MMSFTMAISVKDVDYLAYLARIRLTPEECERFTRQLDEILGHVQKLKTARTDNVSPTSHALKLTNVFREDEKGNSLSPEEAVANAPDKEGPFFKVPRIIDIS